MATGAADRHGQPGRAGGQRAGAGGEDAGRQPRRQHVQPERGDRLTGRVQQTLLEHPGGAVVALLPRLEHEQHRAGELGPVCGEPLGGADQHRGVQVVAARVHRTRNRRGVVQTGLLGERQRVHICPEQHRRACRRTVENRDHRRQGAASYDPKLQALQRGDHLALRPRQVEPHLRMPVETATKRAKVTHTGPVPRAPGFDTRAARGVSARVAPQRRSSYR